jgi:hypothetical protein
MTGWRERRPLLMILLGACLALAAYGSGLFAAQSMARSATGALPSSSRVVGRIPPGSRELTVRVTRFGRVAQGFAVRSSRRVASARRLLNALLPFPPGTYSCPVDRGARIRLAFLHAPKSAPLAVAVVDPGGCGRGSARPASGWSPSTRRR